jgi:outer membrane protein assembly factor BamB
MTYILHRGGDRFLLQSNTTGAYIGSIIAGNLGESERAFSYDFGTTYQADRIINIKDFPELAQMPFFAIDYSGIPDIENFLENAPDLYYFLLAEYKAFAYHFKDLNKTQNQSQLPILWQYTPPNPEGFWKIPIWSLFVNEEGCLIGNREGLIISFNHDGNINYQHKLTRKINSFVGNESCLYGGCDDGGIYNLREKLPRSVYYISPPVSNYDLQIFGLTLQNTNLLLIDTYGTVTLFDAEFNIIRKNEYKHWRSWFFDCDQENIYIGHFKGLNCYDLHKGKLKWEINLNTPILWGDLTKDCVIVGTTEGKIYQVNKQGDWKIKTTEIKLLCDCKNPLYSGVIHQEKQLIFTADFQGYLYSFNFQGELIWQERIQQGSILNLKYWQDQLYCVTTEGTILAICNH